ncbi:LysR family transcriptional regulator [Bordetella tumulicola]|uniref:LysR family transcriptional regulator n=1 Tax=Bordetella tumulicola TaxID=1649133 RepID=UPI0039EE5971
MTLKQIEAFYWAATLGSFGIAAARLHITQSSLSKRIAELESELGRALFDRSAKKSVLTEVGERLLPRCRAALDLIEAISHHDDASDERALTGTCKFGISELSASTWLPRFVDRVRASYPKLMLEPQVVLTRQLERLVQRGELDFAVIAGTPASSSIDSQTVARVSFSWVASPRFARAGQTLVAKDFGSLDILTHPPESGLATVFNSWLTVHNLKVRRAIVCNSLTTITGLTVSNMGLSFLPSDYVQPLVERAKLVTLHSEPALPMLDYNFIWLRDDIRPMTHVMKKLILSSIDFSIPNELWL